ncbi:MAG: hypothetical protein WAS21_23185 [Geminicoccaceae bacterium]
MALTALPTVAAAERLVGRAHVIDGDTFVVAGIHVRERVAARCRGRKKPWSCCRSGNADRIRAAEIEHAVEDLHGLRHVGVEAQAIADDALPMPIIARPPASAHQRGAAMLERIERRGGTPRRKHISEVQ